jgi:hypothetical protein
VDEVCEDRLSCVAITHSFLSTALCKKRWVFNFYGLGRWSEGAKANIHRDQPLKRLEPKRRRVCSRLTKRTFVQTHSPTSRTRRETRRQTGRCVRALGTRWCLPTGEGRCTGERVLRSRSCVTDAEAQRQTVPPSGRRGPGTFPCPCAERPDRPVRR